LEFLRHPIHYGPVRGAYNACISRVGCYGQPVTNTRSSITSLPPLLSPLSPYFPFSHSLSCSLFPIFFLSSHQSLPLPLFLFDAGLQWRNSHRIGTREPIIDFEKERFRVLQPHIITWVCDYMRGEALLSWSFSFDNTYSDTNVYQEYF